jgi:hypothetical protein
MIPSEGYCEFIAYDPDECSCTGIIGQSTPKDAQSWSLCPVHGNLFRSFQANLKRFEKT